MTTQHLNTKFELKREPDQDGVFEGYASVFDVVDQGMDVVDKGAFTKSLGERKPKLLWQHDVRQVIGVWEEIKVDHRGLFVRGRLLKDVRQGAEAMTLLKAGALDSMSIGYRTIEAMSEGGGSVRRLMELELHEISLVTFPMLPDALVTSVKSIETIRDFERALRDVGFSISEAKAVASKGFAGLANQRDVDEQVLSDETMTDITNDFKQLMEKIR